MSGIRIIDPLVPTQEGLVEGMKVFVDSPSFSHAKSLDVKYLGNTLIRAKNELTDPSWGAVTATSGVFSFSSDGGLTWSPTFINPSGTGIVTLLSNLSGEDRLDISALKNTEGFQNPTQYESLQFNTTPVITGFTTGRMYWDVEAATMAIETDIAGVVLQMGQEQHIRVRNSHTSTILNGRAVYIDNTSGQTPTIKPANASTASTSKLIGLVTHDIGVNAFGYVTTFGLVRDINTSAFGIDDILYLSTTSGILTNIPPDKPAYAIKVGKVLNSHATQGKILVCIGLDWTGVASMNNLRINGQLDTNDIVTDNTKYHYWGEPDVDGSWRLGISSSLVILDKRISGSWVQQKVLGGQEFIKLKDSPLLVTPEGGVLEYYNGSLYFTEYTTRRVISLASCMSVATETVSNTTTETTIHTAVIDSNELSSGKVFRLSSMGSISTFSTAQSITLRLKLGSTTVSSITFNPGNVTDYPWKGEVSITVRTAGVSGTVSSFFKVDIETNQTTLVESQVIDTTIPEYLTLTAQWGAANSGNIFKKTQAYLEVLG